MLLPLPLLAQSPTETFADYFRPSAYSLVQRDVTGVFVNPASLSRLQNSWLAIAGEQPYLAAGLKIMHAAVGVPSASGNFGLRLQHVQAKGFSESRITLAYARNLRGLLDVGASFSYNNHRFANYRAKSLLHHEFGMLLHVSDQFHAGIRIVNIMGKARSANGGLGFDVSEKFFVFAELEKPGGQPGTVIAGIQYRIVPECFVRAGISTITGSCWFGAGIGFNRVRIDVNSGYHPQLGFSPCLLLLFRMKKLKS